MDHERRVPACPRDGRIPGTGATFYRTIRWWDHTTHALSSSLVAVVGYATVRAIEEHSEDIYG